MTAAQARPFSSKRLLQAVVALLALIPVVMGGSGVLTGPSAVLGPSSWSNDLDSHYRYLSGIFLGLGALFYLCLPAIERKTQLFRLAAGLVVIGGLARLLSLLTAGTPTTPHLVGLALELIVVPLLVIWQAAVARRYAAQTPASSS